MALPRALCALAATPVLLMACSPAAQEAATSPPSAPITKAATAVPDAPAAPAEAPAAPACGTGEALLADMSTREKLAQLLMVGVSNAGDARAVVDTHHVGGIMIGSWTDLSIMGDQLRDIAGAATPLPLAVSVDEEGGRVSRLAPLIGSQPSPRVLAQTNTPEQVYDIALRRGHAMRGLGITIDFAPVVDVTDAANADGVIGDRSFGSDPTVVTDYAGAYARGLRDAGVLPVLKHFPGHGSGSGDTHTGSVSTPDIADLKNTDLVPYRTLTAQAPVGVMVGHLQVPGLTGSDPASLSPAAYALLRSGNYGGPPFGGPIFTDDLSGMQAISDRFGVAEAALRGLQAGADVALWVSSGEVPAVLDRLEKAVDAGELSPSSVDASVLRLAAVKGPNPRC